MRMILPEHREAWLKHQEKAQRKKKAMLDQQQWEALEWLLGEALRENIELTFIYWADHDFYEVAGCCHDINHVQKQCHVKNEEDIYYLWFGQITDTRRTND
ncbi:YolD-like protein [Alteribacillus persepolensis]|uniref:YolD-like protein n=1 Tax=Alteribacillus persepolensis TaxID=568899 RepID=A0A1G8KHC7_9BACI|nr:YolD-like family protein [Alteribacillus persepolensis]SDI42808.1 YolD-like protein [Alteribacillus persepolensis]